MCNAGTIAAKTPETKEIFNLIVCVFYIISISIIAILNNIFLIV